MIRPLTVEAALHVARSMRTHDRREIMATLPGGQTLALWAEGMAAMPGQLEALHAPDGEPVMMGGVVPAWPGLAQTWMVGTDRMREFGVAVHRWGVRIHQHWAELGIRRFQCQPIDGSAGIGWLKRLGYEIEGRHPRFGTGGETFLTMGKVV